MLLTLKVTNYALIRSLQVHFADGLNIITGETGAGKSILLGALGLLTGKRADSSAVNADLKCIIEGEFKISSELKNYFVREDLDFQSPCIIRRELSAGGKSRAFVNDTPVNLKVLQELSNHLIDIHSQHEVFSLADPEYLLSVTDTFSESSVEVADFALKFEEWEGLKKKRDEIKETFQNLQNESDYLNFRMAELDEADLKPGEDKELDNELSILANAEVIKSALFSAVQITNSDEENILVLFNRLNQHLQKVASLHASIPELVKRVQSVTIEMKDIAEELDSLSSEVEFNPARLDQVSERLSLIQKLKKLHQAADLNELLEITDSIRKKLSGLNTSDVQLAELEAKVHMAQKDLVDKAEILHKKRIKGAKILCDDVEKRLHRLNMPHARFLVAVDTLSHFTPTGSDRVSFLFSANPGAEPQDIRKIASGGEMSRLMLALKSVIARLRNLPTLIFDEIDTGISGKTADLAGEMMRELSGGAQIIAITHLPQIASKGNAHFKVAKQVENNSTRTEILKLSMPERIDELARMLSGDKLLPEAINNAKALLGVE